VTVVRRCAWCGGELPKSKRGRPRKFCDVCAPPVAVVGKAASSRAWRAANAEAVAAQNASRRRPRQQLVCGECGARLEGSANNRYCSTLCRDRHYRRTHPVAYAASEARKVERRREKRRRDREAERAE